MQDHRVSDKEAESADSGGIEDEAGDAGDNWNENSDSGGRLLN